MKAEMVRNLVDSSLKTELHIATPFFWHHNCSFSSSSNFIVIHLKKEATHYVQ